MDRRFAVAPMMDWTDRHDRFFLRLLSRRALLYTEMVTTGALLHGDRDHLLGHDPREHPVALQLGGSEPEDMAACARMGEDAGYAEININVGCPSDRVHRGRFGACLMAEPETVARCVEAMRAAVDVPVTVKSRIGIDDQDSYEALHAFVSTVSAAGCTTFIVHARKALLSGLSPKQNREIPPLRYEVVHRLKHDFPALEVIINGGIADLEATREHLRQVDGVMMGREAYRNPFLLASVDRELFGDHHRPVTRREVMEGLALYIEAELAKGTRLHAITRHVLGLYQRVPGARAWRRHLSENAVGKEAGIEVLHAAQALVPADI